MKALILCPTEHPELSFVPASEVQDGRRSTMINSMVIGTQDTIDKDQPVEIEHKDLAVLGLMGLKYGGVDETPRLYAIKAYRTALPLHPQANGRLVQGFIAPGKIFEPFDHPCDMNAYRECAITL